MWIQGNVFYYLLKLGISYILPAWYLNDQVPFCFLLDAYVEIEGSRCLRKEQKEDYDNKLVDRKLAFLEAMDECSKNKRCVGTESSIAFGVRQFALCLNSIYKSTAWDKYEKMTSQVFKKSNNYGKYTVHEAT